LSGAWHAGAASIELPFNDGWSFVRAGAHSKTLPGSTEAWRKIDIPHDYSIESGFISPEIKKADRKRTIGELGLYLGKASTGYLPGGLAWYKKSFSLPEKYKDKRVEILFDGVNVESDVWINGTHLGFRPYGYIPFHYDLTPYLKFGEENIITVKTDNRLKSRWYAGSGIYRPVKLIITDKVFIPIWGTYVTTPDVTNDSADVVVVTPV
jgi:beta-galactosidase